jgi:hypothetical protein
VKTIKIDFNGSLKNPRGAHPIYDNLRNIGLKLGGYKIIPDKILQKLSSL